MKFSPSSRRNDSNRAGGTSLSPVKRRPSTQMSSESTRSRTAIRSASDSPRSALRLAPTVIGSDGWLSTGASISGSVAIARANPPVKHMPTAPTPGPPWRSWHWRASARNQSMAGGVVRRAKARNSFDTHAGASDVAMYGSEMSRPGSPNSTGMTTVNPASITRRANVMTAGVMPGISAMTITAGPSPPV